MLYINLFFRALGYTLGDGPDSDCCSDIAYSFQGSCNENRYCNLTLHLSVGSQFDSGKSSLSVKSKFVLFGSISISFLVAHMTDALGLSVVSTS